MKLMVVDCETTGIEDDAKVVEIAGIPLEIHEGMSRFQVGSPVETLVHPGVPIPCTASAIHHITNSDVRNAPSFADAIELFKGADVYVAHNAAFDRRFLEADLGGKWICTLKCCYEEHQDAPSYSNQALSYFLGTRRPPEGSGYPHRALYDAYTTLGLLDDLRSRGWTGARMLEVAARPRLLRTCDFGKHKGKAWSEVPRSYIEWMAREGDWEEDVRFTIDHLLGRG